MAEDRREDQTHQTAEDRTHQGRAERAAERLSGKAPFGQLIALKRGSRRGGRTGDIDEDRGNGARRLAGNEHRRHQNDRGERVQKDDKGQKEGENVGVVQAGNGARQQTDDTADQNKEKHLRVGKLLKAKQ